MLGKRGLFIVWQGKVSGPYPVARVRNWLASVKISPDTQASLDGRTWTRLDNLLNSLGTTAPEVTGQTVVNATAVSPPRATRAPVPPVIATRGQTSSTPPPLPRGEHGNAASRQERGPVLWLVLAGLGVFLVAVFLFGLMVQTSSEIARQSNAEKGGARLPFSVPDRSPLEDNGDQRAQNLPEDLDTPLGATLVNPAGKPEEEKSLNALPGGAGHPSDATPVAGGAGQRETEVNRRDQRNIPQSDLPAKPAATQPRGRGPQTWLATVRSATVVILTDRGQGSGFFVQSAQGPIVVTNHHVVEGAFQIVVRCHDGEMYPVTHCQFFPEIDLAFLKTAHLKKTPTVLALRNSLPDLAEDCYAYGAPLGLSDSITRGIVSAIRLTSELPESVSMAEAKWIQTDAPISAGNSGGPILDSEGRVIGVSTFILYPGNSQNLNFGLASPEIQTRMKNLHLVSFEQILAGQLQLVAEGLRTLIFWSRLAAINRQFDELLDAFNQQLGKSPQADLVRALFLRDCATAAANVIAEMDHTGVAPEAVRAAKMLQVFFAAIREMADARIAADQAWTAAQQKQIRARLDQALDTLIKAAIELEATRIALSQRFGVEFPPIISSDDDS